MENKKITSYLLYAVGEILLVVIGILIAVSLNNANEAKKQQQRKADYVDALISDLQKDSVLLIADMGYIEEDLQHLAKMRFRLSSPEANMDTVRQIARYEFDFFFDPSNDMNRNAISAILSTGDINLFTAEEKSRILEFHSKTQRWIKIMEGNKQLFLSQIANMGIMKASEQSNMRQVSISGHLQDRIWKNLDDDEILFKLNDYLTSKVLMHGFVLDAKRSVRQETNALIAYLKELK